MPIDNVTWQASVGLIYALKPSLKSKSSRNFSELSSFTFFLGIILLHLNDVHLLFKCILIKSIKISLPLLTKLPKMTKIAIFLLFYLWNLFFSCGDIEANFGPKYSTLTFCDWNLNGLTAHDSVKILLLQACITRHNYDIICILQTFLNSFIETNDDTISTGGYNLIRADHPNDSKKGWVCI